MSMEKYRNLFFSEAREHLRVAHHLLLEAESASFDAPHVEALFRGAHSIKGMAATMGFKQTARLAHQIENILSDLRRDKELPSENLETLFSGFKLLEEIIDALEEGRDEPDIETFCKPSPASPPSGPTVTPQGMPLPLNLLPASSAQVRLPSLVRLRVEVLDHLNNLTGELLTTRHLLENAVLLSHPQELKQGLETLSRQIAELQEQVRRTRLLPLKQITDPLLLLVRELSHQQGKKIELRIGGGELELDRSLLETLADPLVHLVRNAADHGIKEQGIITITAHQEWDKAVIVVEDDGCGINTDAVRDKALELGLIEPSQVVGMGERELLALVCHPGLSTSSALTGISGRGVGLDIVREAVTALGGQMEIRSERDHGTHFILAVPLNVSIVHVLLVHCGPHLLGIPLNRVNQVMDVPLKDIKAREENLWLSLLPKQRESRRKDSENIPIRNLKHLLGLPEGEPKTILVVVVIEDGDRRFGLIVDRVEGHKEVFMRKLFPPLSAIEGLFSAAILAEGKIVFILDPHSLF